MTDEKNITPQPSGDGREVISWYVPPERGNEVVRCYVRRRWHRSEGKSAAGSFL